VTSGRPDRRRQRSFLSKWIALRGALQQLATAIQSSPVNLRSPPACSGSTDGLVREVNATAFSTPSAWSRRMRGAASQRRRDSRESSLRRAGVISPGRSRGPHHHWPPLKTRRRTVATTAMTSTFREGARSPGVHGPPTLSMPRIRGRELPREDSDVIRSARHSANQLGLFVWHYESSVRSREGY